MMRLTKTMARVFGLWIIVAICAWAGDGQIDIAEIPYTISSSGSYIVVHDLATTQTDVAGITIEADNVTLDLNGHAIIGPGKAAGTTGHGIYVNGFQYNIAIRNGAVRDWRLDGVSASNGRNSQFEALRCYNNGGNGIRTGTGSTVSGNTCRDNGSDGIYAWSGSTITGNSCHSNGANGIFASGGSTVSNNSCAYNGGSGIVAVSGCTISGNACYSNTDYGIYAADACKISDNSCAGNVSNGISAGRGCVVSGNTCYNNGDDGILLYYYGCTVTGNTCYNNDDDGIIALYYGHTVSGNNCSINTGDGIEVSSDCQVVGNTCDSNGYLAGDGAGILVIGSDNRIESNTVTDNDRGIDVDAGGNLIIRNSASGNTTDYSIAANNAYGTINNVGGGGSFLVDNPWANFRF